MNSSSFTHSLSVRGNILVSRWLKVSTVVAIIAFIGLHFPIFELDYADWFSIVSGAFGL